jgi:hypothetical protein
MNNSRDRRPDRSIRAWAGFAVLLIAILNARTASGQVFAPDPTDIGPLARTSAEYRFPAAVDPEILDATPPRAVEIWARVYRPVDLSAGPYPLLVFLHGNHATCGFGTNPRVDDRIDYTTTGVCPDGYVVVPNHTGYGYLADRLASWGYIVVSINANRGINAGAGVPGDAGLNLARGRLVLRHLQRLSEWNTFGGTPPSLSVDLRGRLDFNSVGLLGHSRGGEGMRAAYNLYRDVGSPWPALIPDPVNFQGIFEIGAVDGQTARVLNADGTKWNQLLPMCDGDVSNLQGVRPFDRMLRIFDENPTQKSTFTVWGANHNFYNTEWQVSDSAGCLFHPALFPFVIGSPEQRQTGLVPVMAFFRGNVGPFAEWTFNRNFNPLFELPLVITDITRVDRGFTPSPHPVFTLVFEDFDQPTGVNTSGVPNDASIVTITHGPVPRHDPIQRGGAISWSTAAEDVYFQTNWTVAGVGFDISPYPTLDFRVSRQHNPALNPNPNLPTNFSIRLALADGSLSPPVQLSTYTDLRGPVGGAFAGNLHPILQTVRIPVRDFGETDLTQVRGVRFTFDSTGTGAIFLANVRLSAVTESWWWWSSLLTMSNGDSSQRESGSTASQPGGDRVVVSHPGRTVSIRSLRATIESSAAVEIEVFSDDRFPVRNELAVLRIGDDEFSLSRYPDSGDTRTLIFTLTAEEFDRTRDGDPVTVQYGRGEPFEQWVVGTLNKNQVNREQ